MPKDVWVADLPPRRPRSDYDWWAITAELRERPDEWKLINEAASISLPAAIKGKRMTALRSDEWEYLVRTFHNNHETRTCEMWMSAVRKNPQDAI